MSEPESKITSFDIKKALATYCYKDFFMTEVKSGSTWFDHQDLKILDGMAIVKSWVHPCVKGFEVKVSRSDFLGDPKWYTYFPLVNEFYMVCPEKMIDRSEIPVTCGLLWYRPKSQTILLKQKATYTGGQPTADMLMYIIMNKIDSDRVPFFSSRTEEAAEYIHQREKDKHIGRSFGTVLTKRVNELEQQLETLNAFDSDTKRIRNVLSEIDKVLKKHDVGYGSWSTWNDKDRADYIDRRLAQEYPKELDDISRELREAQDSIEKLKKRAQFAVEVEA